jgi:chromosome segregation ATPase
MSLEDELDQKIADTQQRLEEIARSVQNLPNVETMLDGTSKALSGAASSISALCGKVNETVGLMQGALRSLRDVTEVIRSSDPGKIATALNDLNESLQKRINELELAHDESKKLIISVKEGVAVNNRAVAGLSEKSVALQTEIKEKVTERANSLQQAIQGFTSRRFNVLLVIMVLNLLIGIGILVQLFR